MLTPAPALVLAAAGLQDPGNAGAIIRSAAAAGATGVVLDELSADPWGWKALRASMGSAFHLPVVRSRALAALIDDWRSAGVRIVATVPRGGVVDVRRRLHASRRRCCSAAKAPGLPDELLGAADTRVSIPMHGAIESLNAAVAAAVLLYEAQAAQRQQRHSR